MKPWCLPVAALFFFNGVFAQTIKLVPLSALPEAASTPRRDTHECMVEPYRVVNVGTPVDGVLEQVAVDRGDLVKKGQVLAKLTTGVESASIDLARSRVEFDRRRVERNEGLFSKQLISEQERDEMVTEFHLHEAELKRDLESLKLRTIVSPIDGVVVERRLSAGEMVRADKSVVLTLAQINPLNIEVIAPASMFGSVAAGSTGSVNLAPFFPRPFKAQVAVVDKLIDSASGTFWIRLHLPNPDYKIPAGIRCSVKFSR